MNAKKFLVASLLVGALLFLVRRLFAMLAVKPTVALPVSKDNSFDAISDYIEGQMRRLHIPGASLAIVEGVQVVHMRGFGKARPGGKAPTPHTPFFIGSLTKSITALAVMQLVEAGKVELDAPVQRYLPWFRVADPDASTQMTVRHLLNQTSGFSVVNGTLVLADIDDSPDAAERQARVLSTYKHTRPVGEKVEYSNINYNLLGLIIEAASGESYPDFVQTHIFDPLEMRHSYATKSEARNNGLAVGYRHWFSLPFPAPDLPVPRGSISAGQLISCAEDMAHYLIAHLNGGCYGDIQILSPAGIDELHRGVKELKMGELSGGLYGMGWFEIDLGQTKTYSHGGNCPDFSAFMALVPEQMKGVVVLLNADPYGLPIVTEEIGMGVTALLAGQQPAPIRLDFIQWIMRLLPLIPLLQGIGVIMALRSLQRFRAEPVRRNVRQHILLSLIPNLSLVAMLIYLRSNGVLRYLHLFNPDLAWTAKMSGVLAGLSTLLRAGLIIQTMRKDRIRNCNVEGANI